MPETYPFEELHQTSQLDVYFSCREDNGGCCSNHWHTGIEILYLFDGTMELYLDNTFYPMKQNDLVIINPSVIHATRCPDYNRSLLLQIPKEILERYIPKLDEIQFEFLLDSVPKEKKYILSELKQCLQQMSAYYDSQTDPYHFQFTSCLFHFLYLLEQNFSKTTQKNASPTSSKNWERLEQIIGYVKTHYSEELTLDEIANVVSLNPRYFCKFFKSQMGITLLEYINSIRLEHIYYDLSHTDYSVNELLEKHGFRNYKLFIKMFKKYYGQTPRQRRKQNS